MRDPGAHMAVCEDGRYLGSLSGGCIENAVVAEALDALKSSSPRVVRFGKGSSYIDIRLPCGGGLDIHFQPLCDDVLVQKCVQLIDRREPFSLHLPRCAGQPVCSSHSIILEESIGHEVTIIHHSPEPKLLILGHGAAVQALAKLALGLDATVEVLTPDADLQDQLQADGITAQRLHTLTAVDMMVSDHWTAIIFLFHDHDWEIQLMVAALDRPHFYIGAMGGRKAHDMRIAALRERGCSDQAVATIHSPIGLFHSARDPDTLALSALAEVIEAYHLQDFASSVE